MEEEFSAAACSDGEPSAPSKLTTKPDNDLWTARTMAVCGPSPFGTTSAPLTGSHGLDVWMSSLAAFRVPTFQLLEKEQESPVKNQGSGVNLLGSFARFDPATCSWKTAQLSLLGGLNIVLGDLAQMGFDARWGVFGADEAALATHCGEIPLIHNRDRIWIVGFQQGTDPNGLREQQPERCQSDQWKRAGDVDKTKTADAHSSRLQSHGAIGAESKITMRCGNAEMAGEWPAAWWSTEPGVGRVAHGVADRVDRIRGLGNGQVPAMEVLAWETLTLGEP